LTTTEFTPLAALAETARAAGSSPQGVMNVVDYEAEGAEASEII
jgi:hypothetical protein